MHDIRLPLANESTIKGIITDNKGKRPENGQNRGDLGGKKKSTNFFWGGRDFFLVKFTIL